MGRLDWNPEWPLTTWRRPVHTGEGPKATPWLVQTRKKVPPFSRSFLGGWPEDSHPVIWIAASGLEPSKGRAKLTPEGFSWSTSYFPEWPIVFHLTAVLPAFCRVQQSFALSSCLVVSRVTDNKMLLRVMFRSSSLSKSEMSNIP